MILFASIDPCLAWLESGQLVYKALNREGLLSPAMERAHAYSRPNLQAHKAQVYPLNQILLSTEEMIVVGSLIQAFVQIYESSNGHEKTWVDKITSWLEQVLTFSEDENSLVCIVLYSVLDNDLPIPHMNSRTKKKLCQKLFDCDG